MKVWLCLLLGAAPAPDYRESLLAEAEAQADALMQRQRVSEAADYLESFRAHVADDARLTYSHGLALRLLGKNEASGELLREALQKDPQLASAWYDLGEVLALVDEVEEAHQAFEKAAALSEGHPNGWAAPFRLAELAADAQDIAGFENWLEKAMARGFSFQQTVVGSERWATYLADRELGDIIRRLITVHEDESLLEGW